VAEEDSSFLKMMEDSMKASGSLYHIEKVSSGEQCSRMLRKEKFDILLLDHSLSDGFDVLMSWVSAFRPSL
jgi:DNA-binding response OmpR family regulator